MSDGIAFCCIAGALLLMLFIAVDNLIPKEPKRHKWDDDDDDHIFPMFPPF